MRGISLSGNENALKLVVMVALLCKYTKSHSIVKFKKVNFMVF